MSKQITLCACVFAASMISSPIYAGDLDDGLGIDENISDDLQLNTNVEFIKRNAIAKAKRKSNQDSGCSGTGNQTFGPGANLKGATIVNLSNNKGASSVCIKKK